MKKHLLFGVIASVITATGMMGANALAQSISSGPGSPSSGGVSPMIININPNGHVLMRGVVESASSTGFITVKSWGGAWKVEISSTTELITWNRTVSDLQPGDFVGILGDIVPDGSFVIDATIVREWARKADHDHDGIADDQDGDDDNDGTSDNRDLKPRDHDDDGLSDDFDSDDDDDGIEDSRDSKKHDRDNDGLSDSEDDDEDDAENEDEENDDNSGSRSDNN